MEERLALQVSSFAELEEKLHLYLQDPREDGGYWSRGQMKQYKDRVAFLDTGEELPAAISKWLHAGNYEKLLQGWVKGLTINWQRLYGEERPLRISLPTYPFAQERYWISTTSSTTPVVTAPISSIPSRSLGASLLSIAQSEAGTSTPVLQGTQETTIAKTSENGRVLRANSASPNRVALRPLADYPLPSQSSNLSLSTNLPETDPLQPAVTLSLSSQPFSPARSNDAIAPEVVEVSTPVQPDTHDTTTHMSTDWSVVDPGLALRLEEELSQSLAQTLYMEQSNVDVERPFVTMGLDSVVGVEWIHSLNKQYACNMKASVVYDYPTIRQLADFLQKEFLKRQHRPTPSISSLTLDDILQQVQQGILDPEKAEELLL